VKSLRCLPAVHPANVLWMAAVALCACSLPESTLVQPNEQLPRRRDASADASTGDATSSVRDAASAAVTVADAASGAGGSPSGDASAGGGAPAPKPASNKPEPKPNGELCRGNEDCASDNCKSGDNGERRCYGRLKLDQECSQPYDCDGYRCVPLTLESKKSVCVDTGLCGMQGACFVDYGIAMCQLDHHCNEQPGSFNECFQRACTLAGSSNAQCLSVLPAQQSRNEDACCPTGGVFNGGCNPARQCGCAEDRNCTVDGTNGKATCSPVGSVPPGGTCANHEDCTKGYGCVSLMCKRHCEGPDDTSCAGGGECKQARFMAMATGIYVCTRPCDPFDASSTVEPFLGCGEDQRCNPAENGKSDCAMSGTIPAGSSCDDGTGKQIFNGCERSSICVTPQLVCAPFCHVGGDDCESGECRAFVPRYFVAQTEVGYCAPS
jgi:hypothetical protein